MSQTVTGVAQTRSTEVMMLTPGHRICAVLSLLLQMHFVCLVGQKRVLENNAAAQRSCSLHQECLTGTSPPQASVHGHTKTFLHQHLHTQKFTDPCRHMGAAKVNPVNTRSAALLGFTSSLLLFSSLHSLLPFPFPLSCSTFFSSPIPYFHSSLFIILPSG